MATVSSDRRLYLAAGTGGGGNYDLEVTPSSAGWSYSSLRVLTLGADGGAVVGGSGEELIVLPLDGACVVEAAGDRIEVSGRAGVFAGATDFVYLPPSESASITSAAGGRFALCGARTDVERSVRHVPAADVPVELRGAGQSSRLVRNFGVPGVLEAGAIIACEVFTPGGNWSSYPAHKHDQASEQESELEEIYYFEIAAGPHGEPGLGYFRTSASPGHEIDILEEVRDRDTVLVPYGWHGPATAAPGHDMYYLNVMAGPDRAWKISDHPDQTWVRDTWAAQAIDPRLERRA